MDLVSTKANKTTTKTTTTTTATKKSKSFTMACRHSCSLFLWMQLFLVASSFQFQWNITPLRHHHHQQPATTTAASIAASSTTPNNQSSNTLLVSTSSSSLEKSRWTSLLTLTAKRKKRTAARRGGGNYLLGGMNEDHEEEDDIQNDNIVEDDDTEYYSKIINDDNEENNNNNNNNNNKSTTPPPRPPPSRTPKSAMLEDESTTKSSISTTSFMSMKDVDEALNEEIVGALRSAEQDLNLQLERSGGSVQESTITSNIINDIIINNDNESSPPTRVDDALVPEKEEQLLLLSLQEAQREADEADEMLRQAEEEAAKWEKELAQLEEEAARNSMAEAYQAALDAATENVNTLSSQIQSLEMELASTIGKMEQSIEDKERISAEYAFLAKNYGELKSQQSQGSATTTLLEEEIVAYKSKIEELKLQLDDTERSLTTAQEDATKWQTMHNEVQASIATQVQSTMDQYELQVLEVTASLEEEKAQIQEQANFVIDKLQSDFNAGIVNNQKMISALRQALRKTRKEKSYLEEKSSMERTKAVEDVRDRMNSEMANLKEVLKNIEGEMGEKEKVMQSVMEGKEETEKLMEEIRILRQSFEDVQAKSSQNDAEYEQRLSSYLDIEKALQLELNEKERTIGEITKDRDAIVKQVEVLQLELEVLQRKVDEVETSNSSLGRELTDAESVFEREKLAMESQFATMEQKIAQLEEELIMKRDMISTSEKALDESLAKLSIFQGQYDDEAAKVKALEGEIKNMQAIMAEAEASLTKSASQEQEAAKQIQTLQSRASSLEAQLNEAIGNAARSEQKLKDYQATVDSMQGSLLQSSTNVQARENELAALKEQAERSVAEQAKKNEQLQSELNRIQKEMSDALAKANEEIAQRGHILDEKEKMLASLQEKYNRQLDQMESANVMAKKKIDAQAEQIRKLDLSSNQELINLSGQVSTLKKDLSLTQGDSQKRIAALNSKIQAMEQEIKQEQALRDETRQNTLKLEQALTQAKKSLEKMAQEKSMELMQLNLRIEQSTAAAAKEAETSKRLRMDLKGMSESLKKAEAEINQRESALQTKESAHSKLQMMNEQLKSDIENIRIKSQNDVTTKSNEINALKDMVASLTAEVDTEIKLRQDVMAGKEGVESLLQKKLDGMSNDVENIRADAQKAFDSQVQKLEKLEASASKEKNALVDEISRLKSDMSTAQNNAQKIIDARTVEIQNMKQVIAKLQSSIEDEKRLTDEAMKGKSGLEKALQAKIVQLSNDIASAQKNAETAVQEKNRELERLNSQINNLTEEVTAEVSLKVQAVKEKDIIEHQMKAIIAQLEKELSDSRAANESALKDRDTVLSTMRDDLNKLSKLKDDAQKERDDVERALTAKNFELRNKISSLQITADKTIQAKDEEVAGLKVQVLEEAKSRDAFLREKMNVLATVEDSLRVKTELLEQLTKDIKLIRADADAATNAKKQALDEKASIESKMRAELEKLRRDLQMSQANAETAIKAKEDELKRMDSLLSDVQKKTTEEKIVLENKLRAELKQLRDDLRTSRADAEAAVSKLQKELLTQQRTREAQEQIKQEAEARARAEAEAQAQLEDQPVNVEADVKSNIAAVPVNRQDKAQRTNQQKVQEPPKGFGRPTMKTNATVNSPPQKNIRLRDRITFGKVEQLREARLANKPATNDVGLPVVKADPSPMLSAEGFTADRAEAVRLERLRIADEIARKLKMEKERIDSSAVFPHTKTSGKVNSLRQLVMPEGLRNNSPTRYEVPSSENTTIVKAAGRNRLANLIITNQTSEKTIASLPVPSPSSQAVPSPMLAAEGFTADKAEAVRFERLRIADEIARKLKMEKERIDSSAVFPHTKTSGRMNSLRQLVMPEGLRHNSPARIDEGPSSERTKIPVPSPSSQGVLGAVSAPSFPKRKSVTPPSSQASTRRQGTPASQTSSPANTIMGSPPSDSPLTGLIKAKEANSVVPFPRREKAPAPASQATKPAKLAKPAIAVIATRSVNKTEQAKGKSDSTSTSDLDTKRMSLKELLTSMGKPIGSYGGRTTTTKLGVMASPEQQQQTSYKVLPAIKKSSLKNLLPTVGKRISSYAAKTTTSLGGLASPDLAAPSLIDRRKKAVREDIVASAAVKKDALEGAIKAAVPSTSSNSNLSSIIQGQNRRLLVPRDQTQRGGTSTSASNLEAEAHDEPKAITKNTNNENDAVEDHSINTAVASMKIQEAFQRALLSARIANDAKARVVNAFPMQRNANLSQMVRDQSKSTFSQQKAFANSNRRTSLFPEKVESHLSRLLHK